MIPVCGCCRKNFNIGADLAFTAKSVSRHGIYIGVYLSAGMFASMLAGTLFAAVAVDRGRRVFNLAVAQADL